MRGDKNVIYRNSVGQEVVFNNFSLFVESIDMTGTSGIFTSEQLAFADGQQTISVKLAPKTIPCSFAFWSSRSDDYTQKTLERIFSPSFSGILKMITKNANYKIACRPQNVPSFKRDGKFIWRFDVDFVADFPYWQKGAEISVTLKSPTTYLLSDNPIHLPMKIRFPSGAATPFNVNGTGFTLKSHDFPIIVNTQNFRITDERGRNCNQYIDSSAEVGEIFFKYGENKIFCPVFDGVQIFYYQLSHGEM